jgi:NAD(P)-dependent dehydrogenase (short-subunit alcohol dehydrogenase family)
MQKSSGGLIVNFSSTAGVRSLPQSPHYITAKAGIIALSEFFAKVYAPQIRVNCIAPGFVLTEHHLPKNYANYSDVVGRIPLGIMSSVPEIVKAILFLTSSSTITGHTLVIDGGLVL